MNKETFEKEFGLKTKICVGSLGFGLKDNIHYEYGYENEKELKEKYVKGKGMFDIHFWLEDMEGNIIDLFYYEYLILCKINGVKTLFNRVCLLRKKKEMLSRMGIHYLKIKDEKLKKEVSEKVLKTLCSNIKIFNHYRDML
jgi:hypothetical protein|tara:strand:- start:30 stop:452 length:423 start_codon:yes stop_codon:yes gene_type:complete